MDDWFHGKSQSKKIIVSPFVRCPALSSARRGHRGTLFRGPCCALALPRGQGDAPVKCMYDSLIFQHSYRKCPIDKSFTYEEWWSSSSVGEKTRSSEVKPIVNHSQASSLDQGKSVLRICREKWNWRGTKDIIQSVWGILHGGIGVHLVVPKVVFGCGSLGILTPGDSQRWVYHFVDHSDFCCSDPVLDFNPGNT